MNTSRASALIVTFTSGIAYSERMFRPPGPITVVMMSFIVPYTPTPMRRDHAAAASTMYAGCARVSAFTPPLAHSGAHTSHRARVRPLALRAPTRMRKAPRTRECITEYANA